MVNEQHQFADKRRLVVVTIHQQPGRALYATGDIGEPHAQFNEMSQRRDTKRHRVASHGCTMFKERRDVRVDDSGLLDLQDVHDGVDQCTKIKWVCDGQDVSVC